VTDYARARLTLEVSENSDYSRPYMKEEVSLVLTPSETRFQKITADDGGVALVTSEFTTINYIVIENTDTANYVDVTWDPVASGTNNVSRVALGEHLVITDHTPATNLTLTCDTGLTAVCKVWILGA